MPNRRVHEGDAQVILNDLCRDLEAMTGIQEPSLVWQTEESGRCQRGILLSPGELASLLRSAEAGSADDLASACEAAQEALSGED